MSGRRKGAPLGDDPQFRLSDAQAIEAAHWAIVNETVQRVCTGPNASPVCREALAAHALAQLATNVKGTLYNRAGQAAVDFQMKAAQAAAGCVADVAAKLALLVATLGRTAQPSSMEYRLAVGALVDAVLLRDGEATLPPGALDPVIDRVDAEHWLRRAETQR